MGQDLESRDMVTTPPCPNTAPEFAHHCTGLEQNNTMLQQFQLIPANSQTHLTLQQ
jgi:hypothetical protein